MSGAVVVRPADETLRANDFRRLPRVPTHLARGYYVALVVLLGVALSAVFSYRVADKPGVYWSDVKVSFLAPRSAANPNTLVTGTGSLITVAGMVGKMVDPRTSTARVVSPEVTLVNRGIRRGYAVTLPNDGGQWANNYDKALLDVQAVDPSAAEVSTTMQRLLRGIDADLASLQQRANVEQVNRIHTGLSPNQPPIYYATGSRVRAITATLLLGLALTAATAVLLLRWLPEARTVRTAASKSVV